VKLFFANIAVFLRVLWNELGVGEQAV